MKKFYVASSFRNTNSVRYISHSLKNSGFSQTYDWTINERASTLDDLKKIGVIEKTAVLEADFLIVLLPAGKGSHIEFGLALGHGKKIYLHSPDSSVNNFDTTSTFYHLKQVDKCIGTLDDLLEKIILLESEQ